MKSLVLLPTSHKFQRGSPFCTVEEEREFREKIAETCKRYHRNSIAEEFNAELEVGEGKTGTTCFEVSTELGLPHLYCEPSNSERLAAKIVDIQSIKIMKFSGQLTRGKATYERKRHFDFRESWWLKSLFDSGMERPLFVVGADHIGSFAKRVWLSGLEEVVLVPEWPPNYVFKPTAVPPLRSNQSLPRGGGLTRR